MALVEKDFRNYPMIHFLDIFLYGHDGFIVGGCFKDIFSGKKIKDVDIFFRNKEDFAKAQIYFRDDKEHYTPSYENDNVVAYKHKKTKITVELCRKAYGTPRELLSEFDFTIVKFAYYKVKTKTTSKASDDPFDYMKIDPDKPENETIETKVLCDDCFFEHLYQKRLVVDDKITFPMGTFERMIKYIRYGYNPCRETKMKIAQSLNTAPEEIVRSNRSLYHGFD